LKAHQRVGVVDWLAEMVPVIPSQKFGFEDKYGDLRGARFWTT
jgi:hypothetical protein